MARRLHRMLIPRDTDPGGGAVADNDYVLGTHDDELERLGLQHRVWRPRATDAWRRAGFTTGDTLVDVGCGPGYATLDLAEIVGREGRVVGVDQSKRFLDHAGLTAGRRGLVNIELHEVNLDEGTLPVRDADGAWCRWVLAFLTNPRRMVTEIARSIRPGGTFVSHEYFAYDTWRFLPPTEELSEFVRVVSAGWRATGGEPDIGLQIPRWLAEEGFDIVEVRPLIDVVTPASYVWQWPKSFVAVGTARYVDLGTMTPERGQAIVDAFARREQEPHTMMITPGVLETIARKR